MPLAADGDLLLLHRFEQRGLRFRRRAVDFVGQHDVGEQRPGQKAERARAGSLSSWMTSVPVMSAGIRSGVNWMRLNCSESASASVRISSVLARPGHADEQAMAAGEQRDQQLLDHFAAGRRCACRFRRRCCDRLRSAARPLEDLHYLA